MLKYNLLDQYFICFECPVMKTYIGEIEVVFELV